MYVLSGKGGGGTGYRRESRGGRRHGVTKGEQREGGREGGRDG